MRHLTLPVFWHRDLKYKQDKKTGRFYRRIYETDPWYVQPTFWTRWGPEAWGKRLTGIPVAGDEGDKYMPRGFTYHEVGPKSMRDRKDDDTEENIERLKGMGFGGCPFPGLKTTSKPLELN